MYMCTMFVSKLNIGKHAKSAKKNRLDNQLSPSFLFTLFFAELAWIMYTNMAKLTSLLIGQQKWFQVANRHTHTHKAVVCLSLCHVDNTSWQVQVRCLSYFSFVQSSEKEEAVEDVIVDQGIHKACISQANYYHQSIFFKTFNVLR